VNVPKHYPKVVNLVTVVHKTSRLYLHKKFYIEKEPFAKLRRLRTLNLEGNKLEVISSEFFDRMPNLQVLHLGNNPWKCDCE